MYDLDYAMFQNCIDTRNTETGVFARFYDKLIKTGELKENGMPEFVQKTYVEIRLKNSYDTADRVADESDFRRFPREYNYYLSKKEKTKDGTPLNMFAFLTAPQIEMCELKDIFTVENLAAITDEQAVSLNLQEEKELAVKFLEMSKNNAVIKKYEKENKELKAEIETLKEEIKALKETK